MIELISPPITYGPRFSLWARLTAQVPELVDLHSKALSSPSDPVLRATLLAELKRLVGYHAAPDVPAFVRTAEAWDIATAQLEVALMDATDATETMLTKAEEW